MTSLADLLYGNVPTEADYLARDPFYRSGIGISQIQTAPPRNNTEAFLVPFLQNGLAGALTGYGRRHAAGDAWSDSKISLAPYLAAASQAKEADPSYTAPASIAPFLSDEMPEGFTIKDALQARAMGIYQQQLAQEAAAKRQEFADKVEIESSQPFLAGIRAQEREKAAGKAEGEGLAVPGVPKPLQDEAVKEVQLRANTEKFQGYIAQEFEKAKEISSISAAIPGTTAANEITGIAGRLRTAIQKALGREMNGPEQEKFLTLLPDWNDTVGQIDKKKKGLAEMVEGGITNATPILDTFVGSAKQTKTVNGKTYVKVPGGWQAE